MTQTARDQAEAQRYPHVVRFVRETPWAILETKLQEITELIAMRANGVELTQEEIQARIGAGPGRKKPYVTDGNVAVIPIYGVITPRADLFSEISGGASVQSLQNALRDAVADTNVSGILLDIDSPGGSVDMVNEFAQEIRNARRQKPIVAVANTMAASAAYWLGSQASSFSVTPSGSVGSIGVIAMHDDVTALQEKLGVKTTMITAGKYKGELSPLQPLSEEARAMVQERVDAFYAMFTQDVAYGRGVAAAAVREDFGQGRMLLAKDAKAAGMVDQIETYEQALARLSSGAVSKGGRTRAELDDLDVGEPPDPPDEPPGDEPANTDVPEAADSGLSFADDGLRARTHVEAFVARAEALTDLRRSQGREPYSAAARDVVGALAATLTDALARVEAAGADVHNDAKGALLHEMKRFELARAHTGGTTR